MVIRNNFQYTAWIKLDIKKKTLMGVTQLARSWICFLKVTSLSLTNLKITESLYSR